MKLKSWMLGKANGMGTDRPRRARRRTGRRCGARRALRSRRFASRACVRSGRSAAACRTTPSTWALTGR